MLYRGIQGQDQTVAVFRVVVLLILIQQVCIFGILGGHRQAGSSLQLAFVLGLQTYAALIFRVHKSNDIGGQGTIGIVPLGVRFHIYAPQLDLLPFRNRISFVINLTVDEFAHFIRGRLFGPEFDDLVLRIGLLHFFQDRTLIHSQDPAQPPGNIGLIPNFRSSVGCSVFCRLGLSLRLLGFLRVHIFLNFLGRDEHRLRCGGQRQRREIPVVDCAAGGRNDGAAGLLGNRLLLQVLMLTDLQIIELPEQRHKRTHSQQNHYQHGSAANHLIGPAGRVTFSAGIDCHGMRSPFGLRPGPWFALPKRGSKKVSSYSPRSSISL